MLNRGRARNARESTVRFIWTNNSVADNPNIQPRLFVNDTALYVSQVAVEGSFLGENAFEDVVRMNFRLKIQFATIVTAE